MKVNFVDLKTQWAQYTDRIKEEIGKTIDSGWFVGGPELDAFEDEFRRFTQTEEAIGTSSGTASLVAILRGLSLKEGSVIGVQANTFIATAYAVKIAGYKPYLIDDWELILSTKHTDLSAIIPVHMYGHVDNPLMKRLADWCSFTGTLLIEDACQAIGAEGAGSYGIAAAYSFYPAKNLGCFGQGGAVTTNNSLLSEFIRAHINQGQIGKGVHPYLGDNLRLDAIQAIVLREGLKHIDEWNNARRERAQQYADLLSSFAREQEFRPLVETDGPYGYDSVFHLFPIWIHDVDMFRAYMEDLGVVTGVHYPYAILEQDGYIYGCTPGCPAVGTQKACLIAHQHVTLPMHPHLTHDEVIYVCECIEKYKEESH